MTDFINISKKALSATTVKVTYKNSLNGLKESILLGLFGPDPSPRGHWGSLYKPPVENRKADLLWGMIHRAVATRHIAHIDSTVSTTSPFCEEKETVEHLFLRCTKLINIFTFLRNKFCLC